MSGPREVTRPDGGRSWHGRPERRPALELPPPPDPQPGELYVEVYDPRRDDFGRVRFLLHWHGSPSDDVRNPGGAQRGQVFHADEREYVRRHLEAGGRVFMWPSGEEVPSPAMRAPEECRGLPRVGLTNAEYVAQLVGSYYRLPDPPAFGLLEFTGMLADEYAQWILRGVVSARLMRVAGRAS